MPPDDHNDPPRLGFVAALAMGVACLWGITAFGCIFVGFLYLLMSGITWLKSGTFGEYSMGKTLANMDIHLSATGWVGFDRILIWTLTQNTGLVLCAVGFLLVWIGFAILESYDAWP